MSVIIISVIIRFSFYN